MSNTVDFRSFHKKGEKPPARDPETHIAKWWELEAAKAADSITQTINFLQTNQNTRLQRLAMDAKLYGNQAFGGFPFGWSFSPLSSVMRSFISDRLTLNIVQSCVDTVTAKMAKNRPAPLYLTSGGDYRKRRKAQKLNRFTAGLFNDVKAYQLGPQIFRDSCVFGDGFIYVFNKNGRVAWERVLLHELWIDQIEALYGQPLQLHRAKAVDREILLENHPERKTEILAANNTRTIDSAVFPTVTDAVIVRESWRLPTSKDAGDGKHIITIDGANLTEMEEWKHDYFPFAHLQWIPSLFGFYGQSGGQQLQSIQLEINKILSTIQRSFHLAGSFKIWVRTGSKIVPGQINNDIGSIINSLEKPEYIIPPNIVPPEIYEHLRELVQKAYELFGISQLSAASLKPQGVDSGRALRELNSIESDRFTVQGHAYEQLFLDCSKLSLGVVEDIFEETGEYKVSATENRYADELDWKDIQLPATDYVTDVFPVSSLPNSPEGRIQTVTELAQAGYISPRTAKRLLAFPDLQTEQDLSDSREEYIHSILEEIVEDGKYTAPEPFDDLTLARELALQEYALGKLHGLEEDKLELLRRFMSQLDVFEEEAKQQAAAAAAAQAAASGQLNQPPSPAVPPRPSDLVPNSVKATA